MLKFNSIALENFHLWKKVTFTPKNGVTFLTGENFSGKSLLFAGLDLAAWGNQAAKRGSSSSKMPPKSTLTIKVGINGKDYSVTTKPASSILLIDGEDQTTKGKTGALDAFAEQFPIPKQLYDATVHLKGTSGDVLTAGTAGQRMEWIGDATGINRIFESLYNSASSEYVVAAKAKTDMDYIKQTVIDHKKSIRKVPSIPALENKIEYAQGLMAKILDTLNRHRAYQSVAETLKNDSKLSTADLKEELETCLALQESWEETKRHEHKGIEARELLKSCVKERKRHERDLAEFKHDLKPFVFVPDLAPKLQLFFNESLKTFSDMREREKIWERERPLRKQFTELTKANKDSPYFKLSAEKIAKLGLECNGDIKAKQDLLAFLSKHIDDKSADCPVCASGWTIKSRKAMLIKVESELKAAQTKIKRLRAIHDLLQVKQEITIWTKPDSEPLRKQIVLMEEKVELLTYCQQSYDDLEELAKAEKACRKWTKLPVVDHDKFKANQDRINEIKQILSGRRKLKEISVAAPSKQEVMNAKKEEPSLSIMVRRLTQMLTRFKAQEIVNLRAEKEIKTLMVRYNTLRRSAKDLKMFEALREVFGKNGLRKKRIAERVRFLEAEVNRLAPIFWSENVMFNFSVDNNGLNINATRNGITADLQSLSGAETKAWRLIFTLALLRTLPARLRADFIILDEMEANMSARTRERFLQRYLPELRKTVNKIIIVSPQHETDLDFIPDHMYVVTKTMQPEPHSTLEKVV